MNRSNNANNHYLIEVKSGCQRCLYARTERRIGILIGEVGTSLLFTCK